MKLLLFTLLSLVTLTSTANTRPLSELMERMQHGLSERVSVEITSETDQEDFFELTGGGERVTVRANNLISAASGIHWYLKYYLQASLTFCEDQLPPLPEQLPTVDERRSTELTTNFYMNYCTFSYTTAFWDWSQWEREIDLMALNGINMPMAMVGAEAVWRNTLLKLNYTNQEVKEFLCGPAYFGWLLMGNMEKLGGPLPDEWFTRQIALQEKIVSRMRELGMKPVFQSFFGMVPASFKEKYPEANVIAQGKWNSLNRPPMLDPSDPLFAQMAEVWYAEYEKLFGKSAVFAGDLFHEGGHKGSINVAEAAGSVQQAMLQYNPDAVWVIQSWGGNPGNDLLDGMIKEKTLVVDLCAEFWSHWKTRKGFNGYPWVWSHLTNYGGNIGLHGRLDAIAAGSIKARKDSFASKSMKGISTTPEGLEINPVTFDLAHEMRWHSTSPQVEEWVRGYADRRYGSQENSLQEAWAIFHQTAYGTFETHRRPSESVFCALPSLKGEKITASAWSQSRIFYDPTLFAKGVALLLQSSDSLKERPTYQYDAVDFVRQYLADLGRESYYKLVSAYNEKSTDEFDYWSTRFLDLIKDQDALLSTHERFFVGRWLNMARACSDNPEIQDLYEYNARLQIGTWTENRSAVRDYAHKEWGGMLRDYYLPRWNNYIAYLKESLNGKSELEAPDSFEAEKRWINSHNSYTLTPNADAVNTAVELFKKYQN